MAGHSGMAFHGGGGAHMGGGWHQPDHHEFQHPVYPRPIHPFSHPCPERVRTEIFVNAGVPIVPIVPVVPVAEVGFGGRHFGVNVAVGGGYGVPYGVPRGPIGGVQPGYGPGEPGGPQSGPADPNVASAAAALNAISAKTHLTFKMTPDGRAEAGTQGLHGLFEKNDLAKVNREAIERGEPDFVQKLLGGPNSALRFDGKHVVINPGVTQDDVNAVGINAEALGEAVRGNYKKAHDMYDSIHRGNVLTTNAAGQSQSSAQQPEQAAPAAATGTGTGTVNPNDRYLEVAPDPNDNNRYHLMKSDGTLGALVEDPSKGKYATNTQYGFVTLKPNGDFGDPVPAENIDHIDQQAGARGAAGPQAQAAQPQGQAMVKNLDDKLIDKAQIGEAQEILRHLNLNVKLDGIDTRKDGRQGETDSALSQVLHRQISGGMTLRDLKELESVAGVTDADRRQILDDVSKKLHLSGVTSSAGNQPAAAIATDPVGAVQKSAETVANEFKKRLNGNGNSQKPSPYVNPMAESGNQPNPHDLVYRPGDNAGASTSRDTVFTPDDAKAARLVTTDIKDVATGSNVSPAPVKPVQDARVVQI